MILSKIRSSTFLLMMAVLYPSLAISETWSTLAESRDNVAITADDEALYALKDTGNIWRYRAESWELVDNGTNTKQIAADTYLFVLKNNGNIWRLANNQWQLIDDGVATKQIAVSGGYIWVLKDNGEIWNSNTLEINWRRIDQASSMNNLTMHAHGRYLIVGRYNGQVLRFFALNSTVEIIASNLISYAISGTASNVYLRTNDGQVWGLESGNWKKLDVGNDNDTLAFGSPYIFIKKFSGAIWLYQPQNGQARLLNPAINTRSIAGGPGGTVYFLKHDGPIWRWVP
jgi:hypothetical protein